MRTLAADAVHHDADEHDGHGSQADEMGEMLLDAKFPVVMRRWPEVHEQIDHECSDGQGKSEVDDPWHARDVPGQGPGRCADRIYH